MNVIRSVSANGTASSQSQIFKKTRTLFTLIALAISFIFPLEVAVAKPPATGGGKPPPPGAILPVSLGAPAGCSSSEGLSLSNGTYPGSLVVIANMSGCSVFYPYVWQGTWKALTQTLLSGVTGASPSGIANDGTVVGTASGNYQVAFFLAPGSKDMTLLSHIAGKSSSSMNGISDSGDYAFGSGHNSGTALAAARWSRDDAWSVQNMGVGGQVVAASYDGTMLVGSDDYAGGWLWLDGAIPVTINLGLKLIPRDISPEGDLIVGIEWVECTSPCKRLFPGYWDTDDPDTWIRLPPNWAVRAAAGTRAALPSWVASESSSGTATPARVPGPKGQWLG